MDSILFDHFIIQWKIWCHTLMIQSSVIIDQIFFSGCVFISSISSNIYLYFYYFSAKFSFTCCWSYSPRQFMFCLHNLPDWCSFVEGPLTVWCPLCHHRVRSSPRSKHFCSQPPLIRQWRSSDSSRISFTSAFYLPKSEQNIVFKGQIVFLLFTEDLREWECILICDV